MAEAGSGGTAGHTGLGVAEAAARLRRDGPNQLPDPDRRGIGRMVAKVLREPMLVLLLTAAGVYVLLGDPAEALLLGASVLVVIALTLYQEFKSERALDALRELSAPRARVVREGRMHHIAGRDVVVGDVLVVEEGDRLAADARVLESVDLHVDESLLTGESLAVPKHAAGGAGDEPAWLRASTLVVRGHGVAEVVATGARTAVGVIGASLGTLRIEETPMQREVRRVVWLFAMLSFASAAAVTVLYATTRGGLLDALLAGITLAIANIPEEFPVVLSVFLALGAWRMAQQSALVRRTPAIEALGATTVLCTDKTGTLTENRMAVEALRAEAGHWHRVDPDMSTPIRALLETAAAACPPDSHDPMDRALQEAAAHAGLPPCSAALREFPLSPECPAVTIARLARDGVTLACKGAPETVATLARLSHEERAQVLRDVDALAREGVRVLGVAAGALPDAAALEGGRHHDTLHWRGLVGFADPLRPGIPRAVAAAREAGIRVVMLTGDHPETARAIARQAGLATEGAMLGRELDALDDASLGPVLDAPVYARVRPQHKLRLVQALKQRGEVVAMTGDGVNDAPALMAAHVGIAMGGRGTDVAREASAIVLLDDNFVTIVEAIRLGRTIYDNIRRAVRYILAVHVPITGLALLPLLTGGPLVLTPLQVVSLELIIDPACSIVLEREPPSDDLMRRPPRPRNSRLLDARGLVAAFGEGLVMFAVVTATYLAGLRSGLAAPQVATLCFTALVSGNLGLITLHRSGRGLIDRMVRPNATYRVVVVAALALLAVSGTWEPAARVFGLAHPPAMAWAGALIAPLVAAYALAWVRRAGPPASMDTPQGRRPDAGTPPETQERSA